MSAGAPGFHSMSGAPMSPPPDPGPLTWDDIRCLDAEGLHDIARIGERYLVAAERRQRRWYRRFLRRLARGVEVPE